MLLSMVSLTACAQSEFGGSPAGGGSDKVKNLEFEEGVAEEQQPEATVSVASVDVDGLNATISGFVSQTISEGAECKFTLTQESSTIVRETASIFSGSGASCGVVQIPIGELQRGTWEITLAVDAANVEIVPGSATLEVP